MMLATRADAYAFVALCQHTLVSRQALLKLSASESEDVHFTSGQALVESMTGRPASRSSLDALSSAEAVVDAATAAAVESDPAHKEVTLFTINHILDTTLASHHAHVWTLRRLRVV
jgi:hypothetical protein